MGRQRGTNTLSMPTDAPILLTPGPLMTAAATKEAMLRDLGSRDPAFIAMTQGIRRRLVELVHGESTHECVLLQGSGTFAVEAALGSLVPRAGKVLVLVNGAYGRRMVEVLERIGRAFAVDPRAEDRPLDPEALDRLLGADPAITDVAMVFTETTTGIRNPLEAIAAVVERHGRRLVVDAMSSFGALPIDLRTLSIDAICASANKCLEGVPGVSFVIARRSGLERATGNAHTVSLDLCAQWRGFEQNGQWRFTPPTHAVAALERALELHAAEGGVEGRGRRYRTNLELLVDGMRRMGFETLLPDHLMSPSIVTFLAPQDPRFEFEQLYQRLRRRGYAIYPGKLTSADTFRIGCIGDIGPEVMRGALGAIAEVLEEIGVSPRASHMPRAPRPAAIEVNGHRYAWPTRPTVVICLDGSASEYFDRAAEAGLMPNLMAMVERGTKRIARSVVPSFTNPNNLSIVTGAPPSLHGIPGNYFIDPSSGAEVMMNDPAYVRAPTLLSAFSKAGAKVVAITAKDKLLRMLAHGVTDGLCFSAEKVGPELLSFVGMARPEVYSAELSELVLKAGALILERDRPELMYLSTTDYVQHKHAPGTAGANAFYAMIDRWLGALDRLGATVAITADHGMSAKSGPDGRPNVIYLAERLDAWLGAGRARVVLPITDPYVRHHGALGSFAWVHLAGTETEALALADRLRAVEGLEAVLLKREAARRFELPADRIGDLAVVARREFVLGTRESEHDLSELGQTPLRSHGGLSEERVPLILNRPCPELLPGADLRNFSAFDLALNHAR
jgi:phosphonoacetate hydrolase